MLFRVNDSAHVTIKVVASPSYVGNVTKLRENPIVPIMALLCKLPSCIGNNTMASVKIEGKVTMFEKTDNPHLSFQIVWKKVQRLDGNGHLLIKSNVINRCSRYSLLQLAIVFMFSHNMLIARRHIVVTHEDQRSK